MIYYNIGDNMKKIVKYLFIGIIIAYFILYLSYKNGYYEHKNEEKRILTDIKIKEYEEDLKNGVDVSQKNYINIKPSYDNTYTRTTLKISNKIEKIFDKSIRFLFHKLSQSLEE